jgi:hypothetical protein
VILWNSHKKNLCLEKYVYSEGGCEVNRADDAGRLPLHWTATKVKKISKKIFLLSWHIWKTQFVNINYIRCIFFQGTINLTQNFVHFFQKDYLQQHFFTQFFFKGLSARNILLWVLWCLNLQKFLFLKKFKATALIDAFIHLYKKHAQTRTGTTWNYLPSILYIVLQSLWSFIF